MVCIEAITSMVITTVACIEAMSNTDTKWHIAVGVMMTIATKYDKFAGSTRQAPPRRARRSGHHLDALDLDLDGAPNQFTVDFTL